ncbi:creatininase family protein [Pararhizobium mangrovi]|uniref:Creatininase family protein n=1 Tax=Pararhizobium mangrovi TaxID=2590452 RepID=A0A506U3X0_9HYPH|nr:creatininase family protein [Pararhizobium mangrovi]TPW28148.1 creatininase family protein [Pararhizobium mangrovi]
MTERKVWWGDFTAADFADGKASEAVAVLPVAAIEQHGPHLPLSTDSAIMDGMLETAIELLPTDLDVRILPVHKVGKSDEHVYAPGTLSVPATTLIDHWSALGDSVARAQIRRLVIVTAHGGNEEVVGIVAREMRVRHAMLAVRTSWDRFGTPPGLYPEAEKRFDIHGGHWETSLMLHFRPDLVRMDEARDFASATPAIEAENAFLSAQSPHGFAWIARDLNPAGVVGNAAAASEAAGRATAKHQADGFVRLLGDVARAPLDRYLG